MIIYTVHEPQRPGQTIEARADSIVFVKEGFTIWGFLFGPLWLLYNRLWLAFILTLVVMAGLAAALIELELRNQAPAIVDLLASLIIGFEGNNILRWGLQRKGYALLGSVVGRSRLECERRFFDAWLPHAAGKGAAAGTPVMGSKSGDWQTAHTIGWPEATA
ncbi:MAG TPA: DUF2628 domain-containing protein [Geobacterales bacterium]|nr:DUF2628 domain-containing protein [Geobacterales bacterium]